MSQDEIIKYLYVEGLANPEKYFFTTEIVKALPCSRPNVTRALTQLCVYGYLESVQVSRKGIFSKGFAHGRKFRLKKKYHQLAKTLLAQDEDLKIKPNTESKAVVTTSIYEG